MEIDPKILGGRLRFAREAAEMPRSELAGLLDISAATLANWEKGGGCMAGLAQAANLCETLGISLDTLVWGTDSGELPEDG